MNGMNGMNGMNCAAAPDSESSSLRELRDEMNIQRTILNKIISVLESGALLPSSAKSGPSGGKGVRKVKSYVLSNCFVTK